MRNQAFLIIGAVALMVFGLSLGIGGSLWYIRSQVQHECSALTLILSQPAPKPADPAANPSREFAYNFHQALLGWAKSDGCI